MSRKRKRSKVGVWGEGIPALGIHTRWSLVPGRAASDRSRVQRSILAPRKCKRAALELHNRQYPAQETPFLSLRRPDIPIDVKLPSLRKRDAGLRDSGIPDSLGSMTSLSILASNHHAAPEHTLLHCAEQCVVVARSKRGVDEDQGRYSATPRGRGGTGTTE